MSERILIELLYGKGAHVDTLVCVEDVSFEIAGSRVNGFPHSIWQIVQHMNFWMNYELRRIRGEAPAYPQHAAETWPVTMATSTESEWRKEVLVFRDLLADFAILANSTPEALASEVGATHASHTMQSSSLLAVLWQTSVHNSYHIGQIVMLRRALGAWPPNGGGDSW
jgi:uncharacterized damage-inducible protein DinB